MEIFITTQFAGFHKWDNAPEKVAFLRNLHRHLFKVKVYFKVNHNDRDLEFFIQKEEIDKEIRDYLKAHENIIESCEEFCLFLAKTDSRITKVEVNEDGENGAILTI